MCCGKSHLVPAREWGPFLDSVLALESGEKEFRVSLPFPRPHQITLFDSLKKKQTGKNYDVKEFPFSMLK